MPTRASQLRSNSTEAERHLWQFLRNRQLGGYKFRRQHPFPPYVVDFVCLECRLIIELDGGQHAEAITYDAIRTAELERAGYLVLRFWNHEALSNTEGVLTSILQQLAQREAGA